MCDLIPKAERVDKLCAVCAVCGGDAAFTRRLVESTQVELVGGAEMYIPSCRTCFVLPIQRVKAVLSEVPEPVKGVTPPPEPLEAQAASPAGNPQGGASSPLPGASPAKVLAFPDAVGVL